MASAQVLRKQEHLEAGKRRLEEFRKKKAAERAKKAASVSQPHTSDVSQNDKHRSGSNVMAVPGIDGAGTSERSDKALTEAPHVINNDDNKSIEITQQSQQGYLKDIPAHSPLSLNDNHSSSTFQVQTYSNNQEPKAYTFSGSTGLSDLNSSQGINDVNNDSVVDSKGQRRHSYGSISDQLVGFHPQGSQDYDSSFQKPGLQEMEESLLKENENRSNVSAIFSSSSSHGVASKISLQNVGTLLQNKPSDENRMGNGRTLYSSLQDSTQSNNILRGSDLEVGQSDKPNSSDSVISSMREGKPGSFTRALSATHTEPVKTSESSGFSFAMRSSCDLMPEYTSRKSRPSFLDSLNVQRASSTNSQQTQPEKGSFASNFLNLANNDVQGSSSDQNQSVETETKSNTSTAPSSFDYSGSLVTASNGGYLQQPSFSENSMDKKHEFYPSKQNEDFAALEQHIEDLTQEKFSLQRSLEASRALAESLAAENSSLTDSYNQQRNTVNQLRSDMESLQEDIRSQLAELEAIKHEYVNARLECSAADERANILASEVIGLEEKALRLRSSELKLERQLETAQAEILSYKKKISSLEKERQDMQSTIEALQEEKKVLQSKLRKASVSEKSFDGNKNSASRKDVSTTTEDLDTSMDNSNQETNDTSSELEIITPSSQLPENGLSAPEASAAYFPPDQMRIIQNINTLLSELALEKEDLMRALSSELSQSAKLKDLNEELSRKLEAQTQRLELLTAQSMANENISTRQPDSRVMQDNNPYADEGDEVVERVLGWIMKLFPGGPSRRRTSKLL